MSYKFIYSFILFRLFLFILTLFLFNFFVFILNRFAKIHHLLQKPSVSVARLDKISRELML